MQSSEKLCLRWNDFQENLNSAFGGFRNDQDFADVTLVCEDGTQIETHKVILATSSPFFMEVLKKSKHPHPLIYMKGFSSVDLMAMVDFLYFGEANVCQENLDVFLGLAENLRLKGLTGSTAAERNTRDFNTVKTKKEVEEKKLGNESTSMVFDPSIDKEPPSIALVSAEVNQLDEQIKTMMSRSETEITVGNRKQKAYACNQCGKEGQRANIMTHIEANHIASNISHSCEICGKVSRSRDGLRQHKTKEHSKPTLLQD